MTSDGFYYDNLMNMAQHCREETDPEKLLCAYVLHHFFSDLAEALGDGPVISTELRKLEVRYRTEVNLSLETAIAGKPMEEQIKHLTRVIQLSWDSEDK